jgi:hypothetical protein
MSATVSESRPRLAASDPLRRMRVNGVYVFLTLGPVEVDALPLESFWPVVKAEGSDDNRGSFGLVGLFTCFWSVSPSEALQKSVGAMESGIADLRMFFARLHARNSEPPFLSSTLHYDSILFQCFEYVEVEFPVENAGSK